MTAVVAYTGDRADLPLTAADIRAQVNLIQEVMQAVMKPDIHYGIIPGTKKPSLYKPGAEKLCATFRIADQYKVEDLSTPDCVRYRVHCTGIHQTTGIVMGEGIGECSSGEEKYAWRAAVCAEEWEDTPPNRRRVKYAKWQGKIEKKQQVRAEPADAANTILKMAAKRAKIAMVLNVTAASDCFTQDIEDLPEHLRPRDDPAAPEPKKPTPKPPYSDDSFTSNLPGFRKAVMEGKRTPEQIIVLVESKYTLSDGQKSTIMALGTPQPKQEGGPEITYAIVADKLHQATTVDLLDAAADLIGEVADPGQRQELTALYVERKAKLA